MFEQLCIPTPHHIFSLIFIEMIDVEKYITCLWLGFYFCGLIIGIFTLYEHQKYNSMENQSILENVDSLLFFDSHGYSQS